VLLFTQLDIVSNRETCQCVEQEDLSSPETSPERDCPPGQHVVIQPTSSMSVGATVEQAGERTALAGGNVPSAYRTDYTMS